MAKKIIDEEMKLDGQNPPVSDYDPTRMTDGITSKRNVQKLVFGLCQLCDS